MSDTYLQKPAAEWADLLESEDPLMRRLGAYALGEIGPGARDAVQALTAALDDPVSWVRVWAAAALAKVAPDDPQSVRVLVAGMQDTVHFVRSVAAWHLGRLGAAHPGVADALADIGRLLEDADASVRAEAASAIRKLQGRGTPPSGAAFLSGGS